MIKDWATPAANGGGRQPDVGDDSSSYNYDVEQWGDKMPTKKDTVTRIISANIGGYPIAGRGFATAKMKTINDICKNTLADVFLWQEVNLNWRHVGIDEDPQHKVRAWFRQIFTTKSWNEHEIGNLNKYIPGGTMAWVVNEWASSCGSALADRKGRWTSVLSLIHI